tara:strand:- start:428 stop:571 length:144 start_codon:yes stop_codon:yes gene_type:complete
LSKGTQYNLAPIVTGDNNIVVMAKIPFSQLMETAEIPKIKDLLIVNH